MNRWTHWTTTVMIGLTLTLLPGCGEGGEGESGEPTSAEDVQREAGEAVDTAGAYLSEQREEAIAQAKRQMENLETRWADLKDETGPKIDAMKQNVQEQMDKLAQEIDELQNAGAEQWDKARQATAEAISKAGSLLDRAAAAVRGDETPTDTEPQTTD